MARGDVEAPLGLASFDTLVDRHVPAGLDLTVRQIGSPQRLGGPVDQVAYWMLQGSLTNTTRHAAGRGQVEIVFRTTEFVLTVANPVRRANPTSSNGWHGLVGMCERATLLGGSRDTERVGIFCPHAQLPYGARTGDDPSPDRSRRPLRIRSGVRRRDSPTVCGSWPIRPKTLAPNTSTATQAGDPKGGGSGRPPNGRAVSRANSEGRRQS